MSTITKLGSYTTTTYPSRMMAYARNVGPYKGDSALFGRLFEKVSAWAGPKGLMANPKMQAISVYHDDYQSVPEDQLRISVGFTVPDGTVGEGDIQIMELPAGKYAVGSFEILPDQYGVAWEETMKYLTDEGLTPGAFMFEAYKNEPKQHPEGKHLVDICVALSA